MPGHHTALTIATRASELQASASLLGVERVVTLGYDDSGMTGWPQNDDPGAFMKADTQAVAAIVAAVLNDEQASVVVTYDEFGFYGHPDHIKTNEVTRAAIQLSPSVQRLYYPVVPASVLHVFVPAAQAQSVYLPAWVIDAGEGTNDAEITTTMSTEKYVAQKRASMAAHATQIDNRDVVNMNDELFTLLFGREYYVRAWSRSESSGDENDLFGGLT
jgi:LmbE family N-acetylglucosaminyl deacetylase